MHWNNLARDLIKVGALALFSLIAALGVNRLRAAPLPLRYQTPEQRLALDLNKLVEARVFQLAELATVNDDEFREAVGKRQAIILDARAPSFYQAGHVPGAQNLSRVDFGEDYGRLRSELEHAKDGPIIVYCSGGDCHDSRLVASALLSLGFSQVKIFTGGWTAWTAAGAPVAN